GLWHGAAWTFVLWGAFHGLGLSLEHALKGHLRVPGWLRWLVTFHLVVFGWVLFRSQSLADVGHFLSRLADPGHASLWSAPVLAAIALVIGLQLVPAGSLERLQAWIEVRRPVLLGVGLAVVIAFAAAT